MEAKPWVISVLSTDYDLHDQREAIIELLQKNGVTASAFELPDFSVEPDIHSHDSCLKALDRTDIALLIIDKRYGGIYVGNSQHSITEEEYLACIKNEKPCLVFVSKQTWDERHIYKTQLKAWVDNHTYTPEQNESGLPKKEFDASYTKTYVDSIKTIDFVETIQKSHDSFPVSNWMDQFVNLPDLLSRIEGKLRGLSRFLLERLVCEQKKKLEKRHTSTGLSLSLGDVFSRGYYLEPSFETESGNLSGGTPLDVMIQKTLLKNSSILVYGEAGYGKTTILAKSYLSHVQEFLENDSYDIPFYLWLKKKSCDYHFDFSIYICESFVEDLGMEPYPYIDISPVRPYLFFDGFDEIAEKMTPDEVEKISRSDMFAHPVLLTCRQQYALRYINNSIFSDKFGIRIKINTWDSNKAKAYIGNFCHIKDKNAEFSTMVYKLLAENKALCDILNSPLLLTMLLWIVEQNRMSIPETIKTRVELFRECINELAKRESMRLLESETLAPELVIVWSYAAWEVYNKKLSNTSTKLSTLFLTLKKLLPTMPFDYSASYFEALFDSTEDTIFGTFHEQFLEFLVANTLYIACSDATYPYPDFLSYVIRPEINRYFRAIWRECSPDVQKRIVSNLHSQYLYNIGDDSFKSVSKRVHAIYHIGRFDTPERNDLMNKAFKSEKHISVLLSLYFGAIKMGNLEKEQEFYDLLTTEQSYNDANRGYHITYYADAIIGDNLPFQDNILAKWEGTLMAFLRHFNSSDLEHYFLRRIDLMTMKQLIIARNTIVPMTLEDVTAIESRVNSPPPGYNPEFQAKIESAFSELRATIDSLGK